MHGCKHRLTSSKSFSTVAPRMMRIIDLITPMVFYVVENTAAVVVAITFDSPLRSIIRWIL